MSFSDALENLILNHLCGKSTWTAPTYLYLHASTTDTGEDGSTETEPAGGGYVALQTSPSDWNSAAGGSLTNASALSFIQATASWGHITHIGVWSSADESGTFYGSGELTDHKDIDTNDVLRFPAGSFTWTQT